MFSLAVTAVCGSLIATFASHTPPPAVKRPVRLYDTCARKYVWAAPSRDSCATLAYCNDESIHYFRYTFNSTIVRCVWSTPIDAISKSHVFTELREWYKRTSNNDLSFDTTDAEDVVAWYVSSGPE